MGTRIDWRHRFVALPALGLVIVLLATLVIPAGALAKGRPPAPETATNNLSYPALAADAFGIAPVASPSFAIPYTGEFPGLTAEEITNLEANCYAPDPAVPENCYWYPQKTTGNAWQADFAAVDSVDVTYVDWSDNMESVSPKVRSSFRIEIVLFKQLTPSLTDDCALVEGCMTAYTMGVLEYPSSPNELQGTNTRTYEHNMATVISARPRLGIQYLGPTVPADLTWSTDRWVTDAGTPDIVPVSFAPELNVGGKYIFGASEGGWKPSQVGYYRITFYVPSGSGVNLGLGTIANAATGFTPPTEGVANAVLDGANNLTYIDVAVTGGGGTGRR